MFRKILIANRGEIACRVMRTAKEMGVRTVAVFSEADRNAQHVSMADEAYLIGPPAASLSYLRGEKIIEVAKKAGAEAIHPGYGFLSENAAFADLCRRHGLVFIGPPAPAIEAMGSKSESKKMMTAAGVPVIPGYHGEDQSYERLRAEAAKIGYPVLIKAVMGGGGKGMRIVNAEGELEEAIGSAKREAMSSFSDDRVLVEKYLRRPRHVEFQVFADHHGNCVYLFERDCSIQRRHQKVVEEAPAPGFTEAQRKAMGQTAVAAARAVGYVNAGTVEFIVDEDGTYYFMEMNTRLQVEHPVTELISGQDLVRWQLVVASGGRLPRTQEELKLNGHAFEVRIYAENPEKGFLPGTGRLVHLSTPAPSRHVRIDTGVREGDEVSPYYDPMIAKLLVWDTDRHGAVNRMRLALEKYRVVGLSTNIQLIKKIFSVNGFVRGDVHTGFIQQHHDQLLGPAPLPPAHVINLGALFVLLGEKREREERGTTADAGSPWLDTSAPRFNVTSRRTLRFRDREGKHVYSVQVVYEHDGSFRMRAVTEEVPAANQKNQKKGAAVPLPVAFTGAEAGFVSVRGEFAHGSRDDVKAYVDNQLLNATVIHHDEFLHVFVNDEFHLLHVPPASGGGATSSSAGGGLTGTGSLTAPMHGKIVKVNVKKGEEVKKGAAVVVMEAMKMEHTIRSPVDGVVKAVFFEVGDLVEEKKLLVVIE